MGLTSRPYSVTIKNNTGVLEIANHVSLWSAVRHLLEKLKAVNALNCAEYGEFKTTVNPFTGEELCKRYVIEINAPFTIFEIKYKLTGSFDTQLVMNTIKLIKEKYFERI